MLLLTDTTQSLSIITAVALATSVVASYVDIVPASGFTPGSQQEAISTATTTAIVAAPAAATQRQIKMLSVCNNDPSSAQTVTIVKNATSVAYPVTGAIQLQAGESLYYVDGVGFRVVSALGASKVTTLGIVTGSFAPAVTGLTGASATANYTIVGNVVTLNLAISGTSSLTTFTLTNLPPALQPATLSQNILVFGVDGSSYVGAMASIGAGLATIYFYRQSATGVYSASGWTASGNKQIGNATITYLLD